MECSFHFLSRFAQENASVARHESARLPRPPLLFLLAQEPTLHTHTHSCTHTHSINVREKGRSDSTALSRVGTAIRVFVKCFLFDHHFFWFSYCLLVLSKYRFYVLRKENLKDLYCELLPHSWKFNLYQPLLLSWLCFSCRRGIGCHDRLNLCIRSCV